MGGKRNRTLGLFKQMLLLDRCELDGGTTRTMVFRPGPNGYRPSHFPADPPEHSGPTGASFLLSSLSVPHPPYGTTSLLKNSQVSRDSRSPAYPGPQPSTCGDKGSEEPSSSPWGPVKHLRLKPA